MTCRTCGGPIVAVRWASGKRGHRHVPGLPPCPDHPPVPTSEDS